MSDIRERLQDLNSDILMQNNENLLSTIKERFFYIVQRQIEVKLLSRRQMIKLQYDKLISSFKLTQIFRSICRQIVLSYLTYAIMCIASLIFEYQLYVNCDLKCM